MSTFAFGAAARISGNASMPSISGIDRSSNTTSGCWLLRDLDSFVSVPGLANNPEAWGAFKEDLEKSPEVGDVIAYDNSTPGFLRDVRLLMGMKCLASP